jgi:hypothetical protein
LCTRDTAPRFVAATENRLLAGDLDPATRLLGLSAIALAGLYAPTQAAAAIARVRASESDPTLAAFAGQLEDMLASGTVSARAIEEASKRARR